MKIQFLDAAGSVTGSKYLLATDNHLALDAHRANLFHSSKHHPIGKQAYSTQKALLASLSSWLQYQPPLQARHRTPEEHEL